MRKYGKWALTLGLLATAPGITLADSRPAPAATKQAGKTYNQQTADKIAEALRKERLAAYDVGIEFKDGIAIIKGSIANKKQKQRVREVAGKVPGVTQVDDSQLALLPKKTLTDRLSSGSSGGVVQAGHQGETRENRVQQVNFEEDPQAGLQNNQAVAEQIGAALSGANLDGYDIGIRYQNGVALLEGAVPTNAQRAQAEQIAAGIPGVRSVANRLDVTEERQMPAQPPQGGPGAFDPRMQHDPRFAAGGPGMDPRMMQQDPRMQHDPRMQQDPRMMQDPRMAMMANGVDPRMIPAAYQGGGMPGAQVPPPAPYAHPGAGMSQASYGTPNLPEHAWPAYAQYPNSAAVTYPQQYSASAFPYIGPFYPYPQVPLGWRDATLRWDDGQWNLQFRQRTDKWFWFMHPKNW